MSNLEGRIFKFTDNMIQNFGVDLKKFHSLFRNGRCSGWQLEELIVRAIKSDNDYPIAVDWKGNGHDTDKDITITFSNSKNEHRHNIQIKSGTESKDYLTISGHRMGRMVSAEKQPDLQKIRAFLIENNFEVISVPYAEIQDLSGKSFSYKIHYLPHSIFIPDSSWQKKESKNGKLTYETVNSLGVKIKLVETMSWQLWWYIPKCLLKEEPREIKID